VGKTTGCGKGWLRTAGQRSAGGEQKGAVREMGISGRHRNHLESGSTRASFNHSEWGEPERERSRGQFTAFALGVKNKTHHRFFSRKKTGVGPGFQKKNTGNSNRTLMFPFVTKSKTFKAHAFWGAGAGVFGGLGTKQTNRRLPDDFLPKGICEKKGFSGVRRGFFSRKAKFGCPGTGGPDRASGRAFRKKPRYRLFQRVRPDRCFVLLGNRHPNPGPPASGVE